MRGGVARIEADRALEVGDRRGHLRRLERLQPHASLGERPIRLEAARIPQRSRLLRRHAQRLGKLGDDAILQLEDLLERTIRLGLGRRLARRRIDDARGDAQTRSRALKAADDGEVEVQLGAKR